MSVCNQHPQYQLIGSSIYGAGSFSKTASLGLLILFPELRKVNSLITNVSVIQTKPWFFPLTSFEAMFLGFVILQICVLQLVGILPINLNNLINGSPSGKRKKRRKRENDITESSKNIGEVEKVIDSMLDTILRIDQYGCTLRALCEVEKQRQLGTFTPSTETQLVLEIVPLIPQRSNFSSEAYQLVTQKTPTTNFDISNNVSGIDAYKESIIIGKLAGKSSNSTICDEKYSLCSSTPEEIIEFINLMRLDEMFSLNT